MKKKIVLFIATALALGMVNCTGIPASETDGSSVSTTDVSEGILQMTDAELGQKLEGSNDIRKIVEDGAFVTMITNRIYTGDEFTWVVGPNLYYISAVNVEESYLFENDIEYGIMSLSPDPVVRIFDAQLLEYHIADLQSNAYTKYTILEREERFLLEKDGDNIAYTLLSPIKDNGGEEFCAEYGIDIAEAVTRKNICIFEPDTFRIVYAEDYAIDENGKENLFCTQMTRYSTENPIEDEIAALKEKCFGGDTVTVKIIVGQGTDREMNYETTISKNACLDLWVLSSEEDYTVYSDLLRKKEKKY